MTRGLLLTAALTLAILTSAAGPAFALAAQQDTPWTPIDPGSDNLEVVGHLGMGGPLSVLDLDIEQELSRPYAYVARGHIGAYVAKGMDIVDISNPSEPRILKEWRIENEDLHIGLGGTDVKHFKWNGRYYVVQSMQFGPGGPNTELGAVVFDVTGLPDPDTVEEVARIETPGLPGGFHNIFTYKHSNGRVYLFATVNGDAAHIYDLGRLVEADDALVGKIPVPPDAVGGPEPVPGTLDSPLFYHDLYVAWHPDTEQDRFYGGGTGGYYVFDVTDVEQPSMLFTMTGISGVQWGHTFTPSPDGRYAVTETEYQYAPLRMFDMKPALDGETTNIRSPISAWTANWKHLVHNHEVRWPYVFVSGYLDGLQVFSLMDPHNPETVAYYDTYTGPKLLPGEYGMYNGAFGIDVRNEDGLIVISDMSTGFWTFRMEGFNGWNGEDWGMPDISSVQKWDDQSNEGTN